MQCDFFAKILNASPSSALKKIMARLGSRGEREREREREASSMYFPIYSSLPVVVNIYGDRIVAKLFINLAQEQVIRQVHKGQVFVHGEIWHFAFENVI